MPFMLQRFLVVLALGVNCLCLRSRATACSPRAVTTAIQIVALLTATGPVAALVRTIDAIEASATSRTAIEPSHARDLRKRSRRLKLKSTRERRLGEALQDLNSNDDGDEDSDDPYGNFTPNYTSIYDSGTCPHYSNPVTLQTNNTGNTLLGRAVSVYFVYYGINNSTTGPILSAFVPQLSSSDWFAALRTYQSSGAAFTTLSVGGAATVSAF